MINPRNHGNGTGLASSIKFVKRDYRTRQPKGWCKWMKSHIQSRTNGFDYWVKNDKKKLIYSVFFQTGYRIYGGDLIFIKPTNWLNCQKAGYCLSESSTRLIELPDGMIEMQSILKASYFGEDQSFMKPRAFEITSSWLHDH